MNLQLALSSLTDVAIQPLWELDAEILAISVVSWALWLLLVYYITEKLIQICRYYQIFTIFIITNWGIFLGYSTGNIPDLIVDLVDRQNKHAREITDINYKQNAQEKTIIHFIENTNTQLINFNTTVAELKKRGNHL